MGGASQGTQGAFGARRQITSAAPEVPSLAEKEKRLREKVEEEKRLIAALHIRSRDQLQNAVSLYKRVKCSDMPTEIGLILEKHDHRDDGYDGAIGTGLQCLYCEKGNHTARS